jgi:hypothetical protein
MQAYGRKNKKLTFRRAAALFIRPLQSWTSSGVAPLSLYRYIRKGGDGGEYGANYILKITSSRKPFRKVPVTVH